MHESFISQLYQNILGRKPDAAGLAFWQEMIEYGGVSAAKMTEQFISSTEYRVFVQPVAQLYFVSFNRAPEADGLGFWIEAFREGATLDGIATGFEASEEFQSQYGQMTDEAFVVALYQNSLRREPDESGQAYWLEQLSGGMTRAGMLSSFAESTEMVELRAQEVDFALLYLALTGVPPTMAMIQQAVPIRDWAELIESIYTGPDYVGPDVPGLVRFEGPEKPEQPPAETPDEPPVDSSPEPDPGPAPDTTPPSILGFTLASPTTLSVTSSESGSAALFREARFPGFPDEVIPATEIEIANAGQAYSIVVSPDEGETFLKLTDRSGNVIKSDILVELLGDGVDNFDYGGAVPKFIFGFGGDDRLSSGTGDDFLIGGDGNDTITGGLGNDTFLIDSDTDEITDLSNSDVFIIHAGAFLSAATISGNYLATAASQNLGGSRDNAQFTMASGVTLANFAEMTVVSEENGGVRIDAHHLTTATITGSSGSDLITGSSAADSLFGGAGSDVLNGGDGDDTITGGAGYDRLNAGGGANVVTDAGQGSDVIEHTTAGATVAVAVTGSDNVTIEANQAGASVTIAHDIHGRVDASFSTAGLRIDGGDGNDSFNGGLGSDTITGGAGADQINAKGGANVLTDAGVGNDFIFHQTVNATVAIAVTGSDAVMIEATETGATATIANGVNGRVIAHFSKAAVKLQGSNGHDYLMGGEGNDTLNGAAGNDTIEGGLGANVINAGAGENRIINVGNGADVITHDATGSTVEIIIVNSSVVTLNAQQTGAFVQMGDGDYGASLNATASSAAIRVEGNIGDDSFIGGAGNDTISGDNGNDTITGGGGVDNLSGGAGNNVYRFGSGEFIAAETVTGGANTDTILFTADSQTIGDDVFTNKTLIEAIITANGTNSLTLGSNAAAATNNLTVTGGDGDDTITAASLGEAVTINGGDGNNNLTGSNQADKITGGSGNDIITGGIGADVLTGGDSDDVFIYTAIADLFSDASLVDSITGGTGTDNVRVDLTDAGYTIAQADSWHRANTIEVLSHFGANANNIFITLNVDAFTAGLRTVTLAGDTDASGSNIINASMAMVGQDLFLIGSAGVDEITGGAGSDVITVGAGSDRINAAGGANVVTDAGIGIDVIEHKTTGATVAVAVVGSDIVVIEADMTGASVTIANGIDGRVSASLSTAGVVIDGGDGDDQLNGGLGDDTITGGAGADQIDAKAGANVVNEAGVGNDYISHSTAGATVAIAVTGIDTTTIEATEAGASATISNNVHGSVSALHSTAAVQLQGGNGNDSLRGGTGNDTITGGIGADLLTGGLGSDLFIFEKILDSTLITSVAQESDLIADFTSGMDKIVATLDYTVSSADLTFDARFLPSGSGIVPINNSLSGAIGQAAFDTANKALLINGNDDRRIDTSNDYWIRFDTVYNPLFVEDGDVNFVIRSGSGNDAITSGAGNDTITGGAGVDALTGGLGTDDFVYTSTGQGGTAGATNAANVITVGDGITNFVSLTDDIDVSATATGGSLIVTGAGVGSEFDSATDSLGIVNIDFDFSASSNAGAVAAALNTAFDQSNGGISIGDGTYYFAILDADGANPDFFNIFEVINTGGPLATFIDAGITISNIATVDATLVAGDFIVF